MNLNLRTILSTKPINMQKNKCQNYIIKGATAKFEFSLSEINLRKIEEIRQLKFIFKQSNKLIYFSLFDRMGEDHFVMDPHFTYKEDFNLPRLILTISGDETMNLRAPGQLDLEIHVNPTIDAIEAFGLNDSIILNRGKIQVYNSLTSDLSYEKNNECIEGDSLCQVTI